MMQNSIATRLTFVHDPVASLLTNVVAERKLCVVHRTSCHCDAGASYTCTKLNSLVEVGS